MIGEYITRNFTGIAGVIVLIILIFLAIREFVTWYWKLNKISNLLEKINESLEFLVKATTLSMDKEKLESLKKEVQGITKKNDQSPSA